ncbi:hypothetical protein CDEST_04134 [Colletotrichum destructivum]|uniref:Uncharacterized protein n=1 Tax=Colletotrichum destructivum TaxID=34406 RepID=A0AAX4I6V6_9PEZI|nr:hypothetical protein CDEST_04134 [Colletotrichum destructivum]
MLPHALITLAATAALMFQSAHGLPAGELEDRQAPGCLIRTQRFENEFPSCPTDSPPVPTCQSGRAGRQLSWVADPPVPRGSRSLCSGTLRYECCGDR